jgi:hypothetical protein
VIIADMRSSMGVAGSAATIGCAFDLDVDFDFCSRCGQLSGGVA